MDFDRIYNSRRQPAHLDDFLDSNVQALIEGRRKHPMLRPNVERGRSFSSPSMHWRPRVVGSTSKDGD